MKTAHRQASQHKRRQRALYGSPVFKAVQAHQAAEAAREFASQVLHTRIALLSAADGQDATDLLARLAVVIGTPCESGARLYGHEPLWVRQLHGALRTIQALCLDGYLWRSQYALALDRAVDIAAQQRNDLDHDTFVAAWLEANKLCAEIMHHSVRADSVTA